MLLIRLNLGLHRSANRFWPIGNRELPNALTAAVRVKSLDQKSDNLKLTNLNVHSISRLYGATRVGKCLPITVSGNRSAALAELANLLERRNHQFGVRSRRDPFGPVTRIAELCRLGTSFLKLSACLPACRTSPVSMPGHFSLDCRGSNQDDALRGLLLGFVSEDGHPPRAQMSRSADKTQDELHPPHTTRLTDSKSDGASAVSFASEYSEGVTTE